MNGYSPLAWQRYTQFRKDGECHVGAKGAEFAEGFKVIGAHDYREEYIDETGETQSYAVLRC